MTEDRADQRDGASAADDLFCRFGDLLAFRPEGWTEAGGAFPAEPAPLPAKAPMPTSDRPQASLVA